MREREPALQMPRSLKKEGAKVLQKFQSRNSIAANRQDCDNAGCPPAANGKPQWSKYPPCSTWRTPDQSMRRCPEGNFSPWRTQAGEDPWQEPWPMQEAHTRRDFQTRTAACRSITFLMDCTPWKGFLLKQWRRTCVGKVHEGLYSLRGPHGGAREEHKEKEQQI